MEKVRKSKRENEVLKVPNDKELLPVKCNWIQKKQNEKQWIENSDANYVEQNIWFYFAK